MTDWLNRCHVGDALTVLRTMPAGLAQTCVTSPPYFGLRSYLPEDHPDKALEMGQEESPDAFVDAMVAVFREVRRVLRDDGTLWVNIGDSYAGARRGGDVNGKSTLQGSQSSQNAAMVASRRRDDAPVPRSDRRFDGYKPKDLLGIPWMLAFALRADGWYLRQEVIWRKKNCMPESVTDRPTRNHEQVFLLSKRPVYYYDHEAIMEPVSASTHARVSQDLANQKGTERANGGSRADRPLKAVVSRPKVAAPGSGVKANSSFEAATSGLVSMRNKRSVWDVATRGYSGAHFAVFPPDLIEPCILAGAPPGGVVLDPFFGSGTTGQVAVTLGRQFVGIDLNPEYSPLQEQRQRGLQPRLVFA